jgi:hypothetical protein
MNLMYLKLESKYQSRHKVDAMERSHKCEKTLGPKTTTHSNQDRNGSSTNQIVPRSFPTGGGHTSALDVPAREGNVGVDIMQRNLRDPSLGSPHADGF